jgi:hypothetical protein
VLPRQPQRSIGADPNPQTTKKKATAHKMNLGSYSHILTIIATPF